MFFFLIRSVFFELSRRYFCTLLHTSANVPSTATSSRHKGRKRHENCFKDMLTALNQRLVSRFSFLFYSSFGPPFVNALLYCVTYINILPSLAHQIQHLLQLCSVKRRSPPVEYFSDQLSAKNRSRPTSFGLIKTIGRIFTLLCIRFYCRSKPYRPVSILLDTYQPPCSISMLRNKPN